MSKILDQRLSELQQQVAAMARLVEQSLKDSVAALVQSDRDNAGAVCRGDQAINDEKCTIAIDAVAVIAMHQPVARDVRLLVGILEISTELERMGDYSKDIARIAIQRAPKDLATPNGISAMADQAASMLAHAMTAFISGDTDQAATIAREDDDVDSLCEQLHRDLLSRGYNDESELGQATLLLTVIHHVERFADRVTNICEQIVYIESGDHVEFSD